VDEREREREREREGGRKVKVNGAGAARPHMQSAGTRDVNRGEGIAKGSGKRVDDGCLRIDRKIVFE
jgi:hypothetical protein